MTWQMIVADAEHGMNATTCWEYLNFDLCDIVRDGLWGVVIFFYVEA